MFSFGIEYERAFSIAFWSARFAAGSPPPSRAATMRARASFEKSLPRFASAAPFLCLIELHLLCPDTHRLPDLIEEQLVHPRIFRQLGVERRNEEAPLPEQDGLPIVLGQDLDVVAHLAHARGADEDAAQRPRVAVQPKIRLEARNLPAVRVAVDLEIHQTEMRAVEDDHPRARSEDGRRKGAERVVEPVQAHQTHERRRLAAGHDEAVEAVELLPLPDLDDVGAEAPQHRLVLPEIALHGEDPDLHAGNASPGARLDRYVRRV